jgi:hypothetical protein
MQNKKKVFTWPLSILVITVSFLSVLAVLKQVEAAWLEPNYLPGDASLSNNFVFTPLVQNLELGGKNITGNGNININGSASFSSLTVDGVPVSGGGGGAGSADWAILSGALYYTTSTGSGKVGIGTNNPNRLLHLYKDSGDNAELDIQSNSGAGNHWSIYNHRGTDELRFWKSAGDNVLTLGANGRVGVGTAPDDSNILRTRTATAGVVGLYGENSAIDWSFVPNLNPNNVGVKGVANNTVLGGVGVYGLGYHGVKGVGGNGGAGIYGEASAGGIGVRGVQGPGSYAAQFDGEVAFNGNARVALPGYFTISNGLGAPTVGDCSTFTYGRIYLDRQNFRLYVCTGVTGWKSTLLN